MENRTSNGDMWFKTELGKRFIRWTAVTNASSQNFIGSDPWASKVRLTSVMCLCLRSARPFCSCWYGQLLLWVIPWDVKKLDSEQENYFHPASLKTGDWM